MEKGEPVNLISKRKDHVLLIGILILMSAANRLRADEIILNDGNTLTGTITKEDASEYTIRLRKNMYLRVEKESVSRVIRSEKKKEEPNVIRLLPPPAKSTSPAAPVKSTAPAPAVMNIVEAARGQERINKNVRISETIIYKTYEVPGESLEEIKDHILDRANGKGVKVGPERVISNISWEPIWSGETGRGARGAKWNAAVIRATITVILPEWKAPDEPNNETVIDWNKFIEDTEAYERGRIRIYGSALDSFSEALQGLRTPSEKELKLESDKLFDQMKVRAQKRQQGYVRRSTERPLYRGRK